MLKNKPIQFQCYQIKPIQIDSNSVVKEKIKQYKKMTKWNKINFCKVCNKRFLSHSAFKAHNRFLHFESNSYECPFENCQKKFNNKYRLKVHLLSHGNIKPFKCPVCGRSFREKGTLLFHKVTHSKEKPFKCQYCVYRCKTIPQIKNHLKKEHGQTNFYCCGKCGEKFPNKSDLKHHLNKHVLDKLYSDISNEQIIKKSSSEDCTDISGKDNLLEVREVSFGVYFIED